MQDDAAFPDGRADMRVYAPGRCATFRRTSEPLGALSNMAPDFPLVVSGVAVGSSEALYQCLRFPHLPDVQRRILAAASPMAAKEACVDWRGQSRADWGVVRVEVMRWCLRVKLAQHAARVVTVLGETGGLPIVEVSTRDELWGAKPQDDGTFVGANVLGRLWTQIREELGRPPAAPLLPALTVDGCVLIGREAR